MALIDLTSRDIGSIYKCNINLALAEVYPDQVGQFPDRKCFTCAGRTYDAPAKVITLLVDLLRERFPASSSSSKGIQGRSVPISESPGWNGMHRRVVFTDRTGLVRSVKSLGTTHTRLIVWPTDRFGIKGIDGQPVPSYIGVYSVITPHYPEAVIFAAHTGPVADDDAYQSDKNERVSYHLNSYIKYRLDLGGPDYMQMDMVIEAMWNLGYSYLLPP